MEEVAGELDEVMVAVAARAGAAWHPWQHIEWLRLQADLLDRLGAAFGGPGSCRAELLRDRAERMADRLNGMPSAPPAPAQPAPACRSASRRTGPPEQRARLREVARHGHLLHPEHPEPPR